MNHSASYIIHGYLRTSERFFADSRTRAVQNDRIRVLYYFVVVVSVQFSSVQSLDLSAEILFQFFVCFCFVFLLEAIVGSSSLGKDVCSLSLSIQFLYTCLNEINAIPLLSSVAYFPSFSSFPARPRRYGFRSSPLSLCVHQYSCRSRW